MSVLSQLTKAVREQNLTGALFKPVVQGIWAVKVRPTAHRVVFTFLTTQQCVPLIEIFRQTGANRYSYEDMVPSNLVRTVWPVLAGTRWQHEVVVDNLDEASDFWFRITAYSDPSVMPGMTPAYQSGWFATSRRTMTIDIDEIRVERAGDPSGDGELRMLFSIWNYATRKPIFTYRLPKKGFADISDGHVETAILEKKVSIVSPPDYLGFYTACEDNDRWPVPMGLIGILGEPSLDDQMTPFRYYENTTDWDQVKTLDVFHVPDYNGVQGYKLTLDSGEWKLWYKFNLTIMVRTTPSKQPPLVFGHFDSGHELTEIPVQTMSLVPGRGAAQHIAAGKAEALVAVSEDGRLRWSPRIDRDYKLWQSLPDELQGPVAAISTPDRTSHLFAIGIDGRMRHTRLGDAEETSLSWHDIGGSLTGHPAVVQAPGGKKLWLFALGPNGSVQYCEAAADCRRNDARWLDLGGAFVSGLTAQIANGSRCHVFALDSEGAAHHLLLSPTGVNGRHRWRRLGGEGLVTLTAVSLSDGALALFGLDRQRRLFGRLLSARAWLPENDEWLDLGEYDSFGRKERRRDRKEPEGMILKGGNGKTKARRKGAKPKPPYSEIRARATGARA